MFYTSIGLKNLRCKDQNAALKVDSRIARAMGGYFEGHKFERDAVRECSGVSITSTVSLNRAQVDGIYCKDGGGVWRFMAAASSDVGTTSSPTVTAVRFLSRYCLRQRK